MDKDSKKSEKDTNVESKNGETSKANQEQADDPASKMVLNEKGELDYIVTEDEYWDQLELLREKEKELGVRHRTSCVPVNMSWACDKIVCRVYSNKDADPNSISERLWRILGPQYETKSPLSADFEDPNKCMGVIFDEDFEDTWWQNMISHKSYSRK